MKSLCRLRWGYGTNDLIDNNLRTWENYTINIIF